ncbi:TetR/AcrR family transcriptional regulator [Jatrophihabitans telluris]|uniref:TetR/AcrR family transcriptional regulator n=1 Tax=Jatrophihabitans telluris TaxID=2038343 RepID=A0ABY4QXW0_9ACTN|nr:TetR/AcrR family transcriptional regulator [Jatrophihabitans telluris]UQX88511.1 TetR/AcrR family transcriptional regulator [Jatrophihabitans telluris]
MNAQRRVRLSPDQRREQLLELGVELLATRTLDELSVELLAEEAGISRGLLFHYFKNKQEFHREVVRRAAEDLLRVTDPDPNLPAEQQLASSMAAYVDYVSEKYQSYVSLVRGAASGDDQLREIADATRSALTDRITSNLANLGLHHTPAALLAARGWTAYAEELVVSWAAAPPIPRDELIRMLTESLAAVIATAR